jgi:hypothetical protein
MVINFRARKISRGMRKLARTSMLNKKKNAYLKNVCESRPDLFP